MPSERRKRERARRKLEHANIKAGLDKKHKCGKIKQNGEPCKQPKGWGTTHPGTGKCMRHGGTTRQGRLAAHKEEVNGLAKPIEISPGQALAGVLHLSAGQLQYVSLKVAGLQEREIMTDIGINPWIRLQRSLMHDTAKFAKIAADAGIDERIASLAEEQTALVAKMIEAVAGDLNLSPEQKELLGPAVRQHLTLVQESS